MNNETPEILNLALKDLDELCALDSRVFPPDAREDRDVFEDRLKVFPDGCLKCVIDGKIVGYLTSELWDSVHSMEINRKASVFHNKDGQHGFVSAFGVDPDFQRRGFGTLLLNAYVSLSVEKGIKSIYLRPMKEVLNFYYRYGFKSVGQMTSDGEVHEVLELLLS